MAAVLAASAVCGSPALAQQTLTLSYKLDVRNDAAQPAPPLVMRCSGYNWVAAIGTCGRDLLARIAPAAERIARAVPFGGNDSDAAAAPAPAETEPARTDAATAPRPDVPDSPGLGLAAPERSLRAAASRTADLLLRLGSRHRIRSNEEAALESGRFVDTNYQTHLYNNGHKALGVELLVPFQ